MVKRQMTSFEYHYWLSEIKDKLVGQHVQRISELSDNRIAIKFDRETLLIDAPSHACLTNYIEEPESPSNFIQLLKKWLKGKRLTGIGQHNTDRILIFQFGELRLVAEMFSHGNFILVNGDGSIIGCYKREKWKDRAIVPKEKYKFPSNNEYPFEITIDLVKSLLDNKYIAADLSSLPLGSYYMKEALAKCDIDEKTPGIQLTKSQLEKVVAAANQIISFPQPFGEIFDSVVKEFALTKISRWSNPVQFESFNKLLDEYYKPTEEAEEEDFALKKLKTRLEKQQEYIAQLDTDELEDKEKGDFIYMHYVEIEEILKDADEGKEIKRKGVKLNKKERAVEIDTDEFKND